MRSLSVKAVPFVRSLFGGRDRTRSIEKSDEVTGIVRHLILPAAVACFVVTAICVVGEPVYETNDDPGLAMIGAGFGQSVQPEAHLVYSHYGYGLLLNCLSSVIGPNAHGWVTLFTIGLSLALITQAAMYAERLVVGIAAVLVCVGCIFTNALLSTQFTITAILPFGAAIANWIVAVEQRRSGVIRTIATLLALALGFIIRPESYLLGVLIVLPALLYLSWRDTRFRWPSRWLLIGIVTIGVLGYASDRIAYAASPAWKSVIEYNDVRAQFTDYDRVPWLPQAEAFHQVGWTEADYYMFIGFYSLHPIYDLKNLVFLVDKLAIPVTVLAPGQIGRWLEFIFQSWPILLTLLAQLTVWLMLDRQRRLIGLLLFLGELGAICAVSLTGREPLFRVWMAVVATALLLQVALLISRAWQTGFGRMRYICLVLLVGFGLGAATFVMLDHENVRNQANAYRAWIHQNSKLFKGKVAVWGSALMWEWLITPARLYPPFPQKTIATIDMFNRTPIESAALRKLGIDDLGKELCTDPQFCLLAPKGIMGEFVAFCQEHYGITPKFKEAATWGDSGIYLLENRGASN